MSETTEMGLIEVRLSGGQVVDLVFQALEDAVGDLEGFDARQAIGFAVKYLDEMGLIVR